MSMEENPKNLPNVISKVLESFNKKLKADEHVPIEVLDKLSKLLTQGDALKLEEIRALYDSGVDTKDTPE